MHARATGRLTNGRDLGELTTADGRRVRDRLLFRSDDTGWAQGTRSPALPNRLATVFDLRRPEEIAARGLPWFVDDSTRRINQNLVPVGTVASTITRESDLTDFYLRLFEAQTASLGAIATELARTEELPAAVYCVAGKDRTGVVVATVGRLLGVTDEALVADYTKSALFMEGVRESGQLGNLGRVVMPLFDAPAEAMRLFLEELTSRYPTPYELTGRLGLGPSAVPALRDRYLSPGSV